MGLEMLLENPDLASKVEFRVSGSELLDFYEKFEAARPQKQAEEPPKYIPRREAKKRLGIRSDATIISWEKKGFLKSFRRGRSVYYIEDQVNLRGAEIQR